ncbi:MAG: hypothetical protein Q8P81_02190 [Nanoarchaeota archaeon]|nr:hypothetical protein [Nanoarchaeota archaeon]
MGNRTVVIASNYQAGDTVGPFRLATSSDVLTDGLGNVISANSSSFVTKTTSYTLATSDYMVLADASAGNMSLILPPASLNSGLRYVIKRIDTGSHNVIVTSSSDIDDQSLGIGLVSYASMHLISNGSKWWIY